MTKSKVSASIFVESMSSTALQWTNVYALRDTTWSMAHAKNALNRKCMMSFWGNAWINAMLLMKCTVPSTADASALTTTLWSMENVWSALLDKLTTCCQVEPENASLLALPGNISTLWPPVVNALRDTTIYQEIVTSVTQAKLTNQSVKYASKNALQTWSTTC